MFDEDENDDLEKPFKSPLYLKAKEIYDLTSKIADLIPDDDSVLGHVKYNMLDDASVMCAKIVGGQAVDLYDIKMENAAIVRKRARELSLHIHTLKIHGFKEADYFEVIRDEIEELRLLFIDWVQSFDQWNYVIDRWGLFNPPGVGPFDKDPDEDIPPSDSF